MITGLSEQGKNMLGLFYPNGSALFEKNKVCFQYDNTKVGIAISFSGESCLVTLGSGASFGRSLMLLEETLASEERYPLQEIPAYESLGMLLDCSRGAVPNFSAFTRLILLLARMGYTCVQLYMEDICALPDYLYLGYHRGAYTVQELKKMDAFAAGAGIELIPAVQTLGHMSQALKWPAFSEISDTDAILLAGEEKTYSFIDSLMERLSSCFASRRVNIGMDEAHFVGLGSYLKLHGYQDRLQVMLEHFDRVYEIAKKHGLHPMLWSDMFFRLASGGGYYDKDCELDRGVSKRIPQDVSLLYWDYYAEEQCSYDRMLEQHEALTKNLIFAGGAWKWRGFGPNNRFSLHVAEPAHKSCVQHGVREVLVTAWGDNGSECSVFSALPALQYWAELCHHGTAPEELLCRRFLLCSGGAWERFLLLDEPMFTPNNPAPGQCEVNPPKYLFYQDILCGLFDAHVEPDSYEKHFASCEKRLRKAASESGANWRYLFETQSELCRVLGPKCRLGLDLRAAYRNGDLALLGEIADRRLPELRERMASFAAAFHRQWLYENKAAGLDVIDLRIGGLERRIGTAIERIHSYLSGEAEAIEELETDPLPYDGKVGEVGVRDIAGPFWYRIASGGNLGAV